jgi:hypothetical protein
MAEPDRPPGQRSFFHFGVKRVAEKRPPPEVDRAEVERDVEAKRQARKQREPDLYLRADTLNSVFWHFERDSHFEFTFGIHISNEILVG